MRRLNVRCGTKILGTLEVPEQAIREGAFDVVVDNRDDLLWYEDRECLLPEKSALKIERIFLMRGYTSSPGEGKIELAVFSDDRQIEFWRKIPSFREGNEVETDAP